MIKEIIVRVISGIILIAIIITALILIIKFIIIPGINIKVPSLIKELIRL